MEMLAYSLPLLVVAGLLWLAVRLTRKAPRFSLGWKQSGGAPERVKLRSLARVALTPGHSLHLIEGGGREILLGLHPGGMTVIETSALDKRDLSGTAAEGSQVAASLSRLLAARGSR